MSDAAAAEDIETSEGPTAHEASHYRQTTSCHKDGCSLGRAQADTEDVNVAEIDQFLSMGEEVPTETTNNGYENELT
jgi:hypothetical protein